MDDSAAAGMSLDLAGEELLEPVTPAQVAAAVARRPREADWYLTLENESVILDATLGDDGDLRLSFEEGGRRLRARVPDDDALVTSIFASVLAGDGRWRDLCEWREPPPEPAPGRAGLRDVPLPAMVGIGFMALLGIFMVLPGSWMPGFLREPGARMVLLFVLALPGIIVIATVAKLREVRRAAAWTQGSAEIVKSQVVSETVSRSGEASKTVNRPSIAYEFSVGLTRHRGTRISIGEIAGNDPRIPGILARYRVGARVPVYYDPKNPRNCVLERDLPPGFGAIWAVVGVIAMIMLAVGLFFLFPEQALARLAPYFPRGAHPHFAIFFAVGGLMLLAFAKASGEQAARAKRWSKVAGRVVSSRAEGRDPATDVARTTKLVYEPVVEYAYTVAGRDYRGSRLAFGATVAGTQTWAEGKAAAFPEGKEVTVHYDPANPAESVLSPRAAFAWGNLVFALVFFGLAAYFAFR
jgi:hypothetical protein